jgi:hypothetical protein
MAEREELRALLLPQCFQSDWTEIGTLFDLAAFIGCGGAQPRISNAGTGPNSRPSALNPAMPRVCLRMEAIVSLDYSDWYQASAKRISARRRARYSSDPEYRERILASVRKSKQRCRAKEGFRKGAAYSP